MTRPISRALAIWFVLGGVLASTTATADTFEQAATGARKLRHVDDLVWALTHPCDRGADLERRQCRQIRDERAKVLTGGTLLVDAERASFDVGAWSAAKKSVSLLLSACIQCTGIAVDGRTWYLTGGAPQVDRGKVKAAALYDNARQFPDEAAAKRWIATAKDVRVQLLVKVPEKRRWQISGKDGLQLEVLGYRLVNPCTGAVLLASPEASKLEPDKRACPAAKT